MSRQVAVTDSAFLSLDVSGEVLLCIGALAYGPTDRLPQAMLMEHKVPVGVSAAEFVEMIVTRNLGPDRSTWPDLVVQFIILGN